MAKVEEFKNKITKAQEDLFKSLNNEKTKRSQASNKIVQELNKQNKANIKTLNSLNKEYLALCNNQKNELDSFIEKITSLETEFNEGIKTFEETYSVDNEKAKLMSQKDKVVAPLKTKFRREIQDINIKIDRIDKELAETLEVRANENEEEVTTHKNKLIEFEKRKRFEVNKIQNNTIKENDELQKKMLNENKRSEIKKCQKAIKEIRYNGLLEEKECLLKHLEDQKQFELNFAKYEYDYKCENIRLEQEYNTRVEDTKYDRSMIEFNYNKEFNRYDNEVIHNLNQVNKEVLYKQNSIKDIYYKNINDSYNAKFNYEHQKIDNEIQNINSIFNNIEEVDNKQIDLALVGNANELKSIENEFDFIKKNVNFTLSFYLQNIKDIYNVYFKDLFNKEENFLSTLILSDVKGDFLNGHDYQEYVSKVSELFNKFKEQEESKIDEFNNYLDKLLSNLIGQVEVFINGLLELNNKISDYVSNYHKEMSQLFNAAKDASYKYVAKLQAEEHERINVNIETKKAEYDNQLQALSVDREEIEKDFAVRDNEIKLVEEDQKIKYENILAELNQKTNEVKENINLKHDNLFNEYTEIYEMRVKQLEEKYAEETSKVEKDYKIKMGLL